MLNKSLVITSIFFAFVLLMSGCAKSKCGDLCEWSDGCGLLLTSEVDCIDNCLDAWDDEGDDCVNAIKDLASCVDGTGCVVGLVDCEPEIADYNLACNFQW